MRRSIPLLVALTAVASVAFAQPSAAPRPAPGLPSGAAGPLVAPPSIRRALLVPGAAMLRAPVAGALAQRVKVGKGRANVATLQQKATVSAGRLLWKVGASTRPLDPPVVPGASSVAPPQIPDAIRRFDGYVAGQPGALAPPPSASLKARQSEVDDQLDRGACVAFAALGALEARYQLPGLDLSEQDLWWHLSSQTNRSMCVDGTHVPTILDLLARFTVAREQHFAYPRWGEMGCTANNVATHPRPSRPAAAIQNAHFGVMPGQYLTFPRKDDLGSDAGSFSNNPRVIEAMIGAGYEVVLGMSVAADFDTTGVVDVTLDDDGEPLGFWGGHAMVVVGYDRAQSRFEMKNSWGKDSGNAGYVRVTYDYVRAYSTTAGVILQVRSGQMPTGPAPVAVGPASGPGLARPGSGAIAPSTQNPVETEVASLSIARELMTSFRTSYDRWSVTGCAYTASNDVSFANDTHPVEVRIDLKDVSLEAHPSGMQELKCRNGSDCMTYALLPGRTYPPGMPTKGAKAWAPILKSPFQDAAQKAAFRGRWQDLLTSCRPR